MDEGMWEISPRADKSALGAINRPLRMCMDYPHRHRVRVRTSYPFIEMVQRSL